MCINSENQMILMPLKSILMNLPVARLLTKYNLPCACGEMINSAHQELCNNKLRIL